MTTTESDIQLREYLFPLYDHLDIPYDPSGENVLEPFMQTLPDLDSIDLSGVEGEVEYIQL